MCNNVSTLAPKPVDLTKFYESFQEVQHLSALETSIRFLPNVIVGSILNVFTGLIVHRVPVNYIVFLTSAICAVPPLLMAVIDPAWSWCWCAFWAMLLLPLSIDGTALSGSPHY